MSKKPISERKRLAAVFVSFTILGVGSLSLLENMSIDYYSVLDTLQKLIPASIAMGGLGWVMGMILDKPHKSPSQILQKYNNLYLKTLADKANALNKQNENNETNTEEQTQTTNETAKTETKNPEVKEESHSKLNIEPKIEPKMGTK